MNRAFRPYPPEWCAAETMAYLLDMSETKFRDLVRTGVLPPGVDRAGTVRWNRIQTLEAWDAAQERGKVATGEDGGDPILEAARRGGKTSRARREAA